MKLSLSHITKVFGVKVALDDVSVTMSSGSLYAFAGENGAGKSTLANIISKKSFCDGEIYAEENSEQTEYDVQIVSQTPVIAEGITVKENIFLGVKETKENKKLLKENISKWAEKLELNSYVKDIGGDQRFYTSLMQVLLKPFDVLILDEPGAYLDDIERECLFTNLQKLKQQNKIIIVISHDKNEIVKYADEIILLKKGKIVKTFCDIAEKNDKEKSAVINEIKQSIETYQGRFLNKNILSETDQNFSDKQDSLTSSVIINTKFSFTVNSLCSKPVDMPAITDISFSINAGSVVLIKGLAEAGLLTLEDALTGMQKNKISGTFTFEHQNKKLSAKKLSPCFLRNTVFAKTGLKIAFVSSNKTMRSSNPDLTVGQLLYTSQILSDSKNLDKHILKVIKSSELDVSQNQKVNSLSGGMLQRLILERELSFNPDLLILCEPLAGLDMQKTEIIIQKIIEVKERGGAVLILSTEDFEKNIFDRQYKLEGGFLC